MINRIFTYVIPVLLLGYMVPQQAHASQFTITMFTIDVLPVLIAVVFGLIASIMVLSSAQKIGSSVLGSVYKFLGIGMLFIVIGFLTTEVPLWAPEFIVERTHNVLFVIGFGLMAYGAKQLLIDTGLV